MYSAAHKPSKGIPDSHCGPFLLDSGAFTDPPQGRLTPAEALARQLAWEHAVSERWAMPVQAQGVVSYDLLIDETWTGETRTKRRWSVQDADRAVQVTVDAAAYLARQRAALAPRTLILSAQGVDAAQYSECAQGVLAVARPGDWFGLGGWCILGRFTSMLTTFWQTLYDVLPRVAAAGLKQVHIFGVMYRPALGGLLWLADQHGLTVSTDSTAPVLTCTWKDWKKAGVKHRYWRDNVRYWVQTLAYLRDTPYYRRPPHSVPARQMTFAF